MSRIVFDEPPWWRHPRWQLVSAVVLALAALAIWWTALSPPDHDPIVVRAAPSPAPPVQRVPVAAQPVTPQPVSSAPVATPPMPAHGMGSVPAVPAADISPAPPPVPVASPGPVLIAPGAQVTPLGLPASMLQVPPERPGEDNLEN